MRQCPPSMLRVTIVLLALALMPFGARAQSTADEEVDKVTQLNKDAITAYQAKNFEDARKILNRALDVASLAGLDDHPIAARTHIHLGMVMIVGFSQRDLGIEQFKKALQIEPEIKLTRAFVTPELSDAFAAAKKGGSALPSTPPPPPPESKATKETKPAKPATLPVTKAATAAAPPATTAAPPATTATPPATAATPPATAAAPPATTAGPATQGAPGPIAPVTPAVSPPGAEEGTGGLDHQAVTEANQGSAISITVVVPGALQFKKVVLAYRPDGATEFQARDMKQIAQGQYGAEIPTTATSGNVVGYYIEAEDTDGELVASRGSVDAPLVIHLSGVGARAADTEENEVEPNNRYFVGLMVGVGFGWATGNGDTNADIALNPARLALAGVGQFAPEAGYWMTSSLMFSGQLRYEYITGTTDIYAQSPLHTYHTANYALALFAKATWKYGEGRYHPVFSFAVGGGRIRHVVSFQRQNLTDCGPNRHETCVDTIGAGPVLLGPGAGFLYDVNNRVAVVVQLNSVLGFPTFTVNFDANVGVAFGF